MYVQNKTMSLSETIRIVKANSSKWLNEKNGKVNHFVGRMDVVRSASAKVM